MITTLIKIKSKESAGVNKKEALTNRKRKPPDQVSMNTRQKQVELPNLVKVLRNFLTRITKRSRDSQDQRITITRISLRRDSILAKQN